MAASPDVIDRTTAVVVLIDMQERLAAAMQRRDAVVRASALLGRVADVLGTPVIVTRQYPEGLGDTVEELAVVPGAGAPVDKTVFDCTLEPAFMERLEASGASQVVLTGMETHICVMQTALSLVRSGYRVHVVADAVCSRRDQDRDTALDRLRGAGVTVTTAESVIYEALGRAGTPEFREVLGLVKEMPLG